MFTSIKLLRNSDAVQTRVTTVENFLKKKMLNYSPEKFFPVAVIALSNSLADVQWVASNPLVLADLSKDFVLTTPTSTTVRRSLKASMSKLLVSAAVDDVPPNRKTEWAQDCLNTVDATLQGLTKSSYSWYDTDILYLTAVGKTEKDPEKEVTAPVAVESNSYDNVDPVILMLDLYSCLSSEEQKAFLAEIS